MRLSIWNKTGKPLIHPTYIFPLQTGLTLDKDSTVTLNSFCEWQSTWNEKDDQKPDHADYVLLLTR